MCQALSRFHSQIYQAIVRHFDLNELKAIIIASPGFVNQAVYEYVFAEATVSDPQLCFAPIAHYRLRCSGRARKRY